MIANKDGKSTSSYFVTLIAMALTTLMPFILGWWNEYSRSLPENSWLSIIAPVITAAIYVVSRTAQQNSARTTEARTAEAQAAIEVKKIETVGTLPSLPQVQAPGADPEKLSFGEEVKGALLGAGETRLLEEVRDGLRELKGKLTT
jgi:hypothetical protein